MEGFNSIDMFASLRSNDGKPTNRSTDFQNNGVFCYPTEIILDHSLQQNNNVFPYKYIRSYVDLREQECLHIHCQFCQIRFEYFYHVQGLSYSRMNAKCL
jgi:hypothetical protein